METAKRLLFTVKEVRTTSAQSINEGNVISATRLINNISATSRGEETDEIKLLRCKYLFANNEDTARDECARLLRYTADKRAHLVPLFRWNNIEHALPSGVGNP